jgi:hypothetical protein
MARTACRKVVAIGAGIWLAAPPVMAQPMAPVPTVREEAPAGVEMFGRESGRGEDRLETDRDSFTPATKIAGRGRLITEMAYSFLDNRGFKETHSAPELLLRYGATDRVELRLGWNYEVGGAGNETSGAGGGDEIGDVAGLERVYRLAYGVKVQVTEQERWRPDRIVIVQGQTPTGGDTTDTHVALTSAAGWELPNRWRFDTAGRVGTASEGGDHFDVVAPSAVLKVPVGERWTTHAEYFGLFSRNKESDFVKHYVSPGAHVLVTPDLEVGVRVGWGLNDQSARFFVNAGLGWRY